MSTAERVVFDRLDFIGSETITRLCGLVERHAGDGQLVEVRDWRDGSPEAAMAERVVGSIVEAISETYGEVREEFAMFSVMRAGAQHTPHADAEMADGSPNHTPQRSHVGLLYLHAPDEGGLLDVWDKPTEDMQGMAAHVAYSPVPGRLVAFPATRHYWHAVSPVEAGERWSLAVWTQRVG